MSVTKDIEALLPHRKPFLFVDEIIRADDEGSESRYTFQPEEFFFKGHFPEYPVVPGVVLVETMAQAGGAALSSMGKFEDGALFFFGNRRQSQAPCTSTSRRHGAHRGQKPARIGSDDQTIW